MINVVATIVIAKKLGSSTEILVVNNSLPTTEVILGISTEESLAKEIFKSSGLFIDPGKFMFEGIDYSEDKLILNYKYILYEYTYKELVKFSNDHFSKLATKYGINEIKQGKWILQKDSSSLPKEQAALIRKAVTYYYSGGAFSWD